jgi:AraC-like DNA-binding protein
MTLSVSELLRGIRAEDVSGSILEITRTGGAMFVSRRPTLHLILAGDGVLDIPSRREQVAFSAGSILLLPHGSQHRVRPSALNTAGSADSAKRLPTSPYPDALAVLRFGEGATALRSISMIFDLSRARANPFVRTLPHLLCSRPMDEGGPMIRSGLDLAMGYPGAAVFAERLADVLVVELLRKYFVKNGVAERLMIDLASAAPVERCLAAIQANPGQAFTLADLSQRAGMSRSAFADSFTRYVGEPPMHFVMQSRMLRAAELLRSSDLSINAIATRVGYESGASMARAFRRYFGVAPTDYRQAPFVRATTPLANPESSM